MSRSRIILYWLLLTLPALALGVWGFVLLGHERERLARHDQRAAEARGEITARELQLAVATLESELGARLRQLSNGDPRRALREWEREEPLIRNVFQWRPPNILTMPDPIQPATDEEREFVLRYTAIFSGRLPWPRSAEAEAELASTSSRYLPERMKSSKSWQALQDESPVHRLTWYWENQLHLLLWHQPQEDGPISGVEVEMAAFLARLLPALPVEDSEHILQLRDGEERVIHHAGPASHAVDAPDLEQLARVSLGESLPHWYIVVYRAPGQAAAAFPLYLLALLLLGIFVAAIVLGGSLLLWQARMQTLEARRKSTFVSNVSHELKTPLTSIRMYAELLHEGRARDEQKQRHYLSIIVEEAQRLTRLVNNVLDFSRLDQGRRKYHLEALVPGAILDELLATHAMRLDQAGMAVEREDEALPAPVLADRDALEQVLLNLVDNALKYGRSGGVLRIEIGSRDGKARLVVLDRGPGVPPEHRRRIFDTFHRVDEKLTVSGEGGTGLGLSIARRLLRDLNGDLIYMPREGGGAAFIVILPFAKESAIA